jgi:tetratricopeptide (TPR) repeat protein
MGNHELAIVDFNKALDLDPKFADALFALGSSRLKDR